MASLYTFLISVHLILSQELTFLSVFPNDLEAGNRPRAGVGRAESPTGACAGPALKSRWLQVRRRNVEAELGLKGREKRAADGRG